MNDKFQVGDVVYHKSNPKIKMVIHSIWDDNVTCNWISWKGVYRHNMFRRQEIMRFVDESKTANQIRAEHGISPIPGPLDDE